VGKAVGKGGHVVRGSVAHADARSGGNQQAAAAQDLAAARLVASPITGPAGNHEYLTLGSGLGSQHRVLRSYFDPAAIDPCDGANNSK